MKRANSLPELLDTLRPTLPTVAGWVGRNIWVARGWQQDAHGISAKGRARLVKAVRAHAKVLLALANTVEGEGRKEA